MDLTERVFAANSLFLISNSNCISKPKNKIIDLLNWNKNLLRSCQQIIQHKILGDKVPLVLQKDIYLKYVITETKKSLLHRICRGNDRFGNEIYLFYLI